MEGTQREQQQSTQQNTNTPTTVNYLPGMPDLSNRPDVLERVVTSIFRRRGSRPVVRIRRN